MVNRVRGDERRGEDGDEGQGDNVRVVQIENAYFEKLKARLGSKPATGTPATAEPSGGDGPAPAGHANTRDSAPVIYNDDGSIYKRPI